MEKTIRIHKYSNGDLLKFEAITGFKHKPSKIIYAITYREKINPVIIVRKNMADQFHSWSTEYFDQYEVAKDAFLIRKPNQDCTLTIGLENYQFPHINKEIHHAGTHGHEALAR